MPLTNRVKQKNIQEADQQPQDSSTTCNHIKNENEFADSTKGNDELGSLKDNDSAAQETEIKNTAKGYL